MKKLLSYALIVCLIASLLCGCGAAQPPVSPPPDAKPAQTIVSLIPSDTEILFELGLGENIVAVSEYCDYPAEAAAKPKLGSGEKLSVEQVIALHPDLLFAAKMAQSEEQISQLRGAGINVIETEANSISDIYSVINQIGEATGTREKAADICNDMKRELEQIKAAKDSGKKIYFEISPLEYGLWTAGKGTFMNEAAAMLGLTNIFADVDSWAEISQEQVIARAPDIIITTMPQDYGASGPISEISGRKNWEKIPAVANKQVYRISDYLLTRPSPRIVDGIKELAGLL